jgi:hypothetical protein
MPDEPRDRTLTELEDNQAELKKNIEASKELIARSDKLIKQYRDERGSDDELQNDGSSGTNDQN